MGGCVTDIGGCVDEPGSRRFNASSGRKGAGKGAFVFIFSMGSNLDAIGSHSF
jgi:hypothetical protein